MQHDAQAVAGHIADFAKRYGLVIVFGASAMTDEGDVIPAAIRLRRRTRDCRNAGRSGNLWCLAMSAASRYRRAGLRQKPEGKRL